MKIEKTMRQIVYMNIFIHRLQQLFGSFVPSLLGLPRCSARPTATGTLCCSQNSCLNYDNKANKPTTKSLSCSILSITICHLSLLASIWGCACALYSAEISMEFFGSSGLIKFPDWHRHSNAVYSISVSISCVSVCACERKKETESASEKQKPAWNYHKYKTIFWVHKT